MIRCEEALLDVNVSQWPHEKKTVQKNGADPNQSFNMGSMIVS
jgi:hypothetical protein